MEINQAKYFTVDYFFSLERRFSVGNPRNQTSLLEFDGRSTRIREERKRITERLKCSSLWRYEEEEARREYDKQNENPN